MSGKMILTVQPMLGRDNLFWASLIVNRHNVSFLRVITSDEIRFYPPGGEVGHPLFTVYTRANDVENTRLVQQLFDFVEDGPEYKDYSVLTVAPRLLIPYGETPSYKDVAKGCRQTLSYLEEVVHQEGTALTSYLRRTFGILTTDVVGTLSGGKSLFVDVLHPSKEVLDTIITLCAVTLGPPEGVPTHFDVIECWKAFFYEYPA